MASHQEIRRRPSAADRAPFESTIAAMATASTFTVPPDPARANRETTSQEDGTPQSNGSDAEAMPPPPLPSQADTRARQSRPDSAASRVINRLSLTLPIAPPTSDPSRPAPMSAVTSSIPPTPIDTSSLTSPSDANEGIIAIAAQERRVLELREELARAEAELAALKKQWSSKEPHHARVASPYVEMQRNMTPGAMDDDTPSASRRSVDMDRRKFLLQNQNQHTPTQTRRRVLRGGHTRTLSLLSPARMNSEFSVHEDNGQEIKLPPLDRRSAQLTNPTLSKRASWQPRSAQNSPMPQLVEDFKLGLRAFVEDIRQITVGDEPITGRGTTAQQHGGPMNRQPSGDAEKSRSAYVARSKAGSAIRPASSGTSTPTPASRSHAPLLERPKPTKGKHFSWTPLGFDSMDDNDWTNWESPAPSKSPRWSGSTINSAALEDIGSIPEAGEEKTTPIKTKLSTNETPILSPKLEEILPSVVNRLSPLSPSNLKRTANSLMDEWEKSLVPPEALDKENKA